MRLCYIAGGISTHTLRIANYMAEHHEVSIISYTSFIDGYHPSIKKYELKKLGPMSAILNKPRRIWWYNPFLPATMKRLMWEIKPDITVSHYIGPTGILLARLANHHPHVMVCQGSDVLQCPENRKRHLRESLLAADAIVVMSEQMRDALAPGCVSKRLLVTNTGVDTALFHPSAKQRWCSDPRKNHDLVVLSTRQNKEVYNLQTLLEAIPIVQEKYPQCQFLIAGAGTETLQTKGNHTEFLGAVAYQDMPALYQRANLYVSTAVSDGTSISMLEAMATDLPCVLADIPANRPWTKWFLFKPTDPKDLARMITFALEYPPRRGDNRNLVIEKGDFRTEMKRLERLYEELAG